MFGFKKIGRWLGNASRKTHNWVGKNLKTIEAVEKWAPRIGAGVGGALIATGFGAPIGAGVIAAGAGIGAGAGMVAASHKGVNTIGNGINTVNRMNRSMNRSIGNAVGGFVKRISSRGRRRLR